MRVNIKRFNESLDILTEQEIRDCLVELTDQGYSIDIERKSELKGYFISITCQPEEGEYYDFEISLMIDPILIFIDYLRERFSKFSYKLRYLDFSSDDEMSDIEGDIEEFLDYNKNEDTTELFLIINNVI